MSGINGNGNGHGGGGRNGTGGDDHRSVPRHWVKRRDVPPVSADQGCYGCLLAIGLILVTILVWIFIYYYNEPNFHQPGIDESVPTVQERLQERIHGKATPSLSLSPSPWPSASTRP